MPSELTQICFDWILQISLPFWIFYYLPLLKIYAKWFSSATQEYSCKILDQTFQLFKRVWEHRYRLFSCIYETLSS